MFLKELNVKEKKAFIELAIKAASVNDIVVEEEVLIESYCFEMNTLFVNLSKERDLRDILDEFKDSEERIKRIVALELFAIMYVDGTYDKCENEFMKNILLEFNIGETCGTALNVILYNCTNSLLFRRDVYGDWIF